MIKHLAVIMDGNRRWAKSRGMASVFGHQEGTKSVQSAVEFCLEKNIPYLSLYTFSIENLQRPSHEKSFLFSLLSDFAKNQVDDLYSKGVKVKFIGDRSVFPAEILPSIEMLENRTKNLSNLQVNLLFCYGSRQEIVGGIKNVLQKIKNGEISESDITEEQFSQCLWTYGIPEPDLIIRTGNRKRLSNFLLFQAAYSEIHFLDCLWPEVRKPHLEQALFQYSESQRTYGL